MFKHWFPKGCEFSREGHDVQYSEGCIGAPRDTMRKLMLKKFGVKSNGNALEQIYPLKRRADSFIMGRRDMKLLNFGQN